MTTRPEILVETLDGERRRLAEAVVERHYMQSPDLVLRYGPSGREKCLVDAEYHLSYLSEALAAASPSLFADYVAWARTMLASRGVPVEDLRRNLEVMRAVLAEELPEEHAALAAEYVTAGLERFPEASGSVSFVDVSTPIGALAKAYLEALLLGDRRRASRMILDAVDEGIPVAEIYLGVFQPVQHEIGRLWQTNDLTVAQEHFCTAATQLVMSQLYPYIFSGERKGRTLVATSVSGDLHEIGVRMISDFLEMAGWDTYYVGANAPSGAVVETLAERNADVLAISATMTGHLRKVGELIASVRATEATAHVKILVGGYPFNVDRDLWRRLGADGFARDARDAVAAANRLVEGEPA